jgi:uncharacterized protein (DUF2336 family)
MQSFSPPDSLISELEAAVRSRSAEQRVETLRRISDLFLHHADSITSTQIEVFDDVFLHLVRQVENKALAELGIRLAPIDNAPLEVIRHLARHDDVTVAAPVLSESRRLTDSDLIEIARVQTEGHLLAISARAQLVPQVTDVLVERGGQEVVRKVAGNAGAAFSDKGFGILVKRAETDDVLAATVGTRLDLPSPVLNELLRKASETVRARILASAPIAAREDIHNAVAAASDDIEQEATALRDYGPALAAVERLRARGELDEAVLLEFVQRHRYEETVACLSVLSMAPVELIERLMQNVRPDGLIVVCKAAELKWPTVSAILTGRFTHHSIPAQAIQDARAEFLKLTVATAQRVVRFWKVREVTANKATPSRH